MIVFTLLTTFSFAGERSIKEIFEKYIKHSVQGEPGFIYDLLSSSTTSKYTREEYVHVSPLSSPLLSVVERKKMKLIISTRKILIKKIKIDKRNATIYTEISVVDIQKLHLEFILGDGKNIKNPTAFKSKFTSMLIEKLENNKFPVRVSHEEVHMKKENNIWKIVLPSG